MKGTSYVKFELALDELARALCIEGGQIVEIEKDKLTHDVVIWVKKDPVG